MAAREGEKKKNTELVPKHHNTVTFIVSHQKEKSQLDLFNISISYPRTI